MSTAPRTFAQRLIAPNESGLTFEELDALVARIADEIGVAHAGRRSVFQFEVPVTRWLDQMTGERHIDRVRSERVLKRFIAEHLATTANSTPAFRPLPRNPFGDDLAPLPPIQIKTRVTLGTLQAAVAILFAGARGLARRVGYSGRTE